MNPPKDYFCEKIQTRRKELKFSQADIAKACGISRATLINVEAGHSNILLQTALKIAKVLDLDMNMFRDSAAIQYSDLQIAKRRRLQTQIEKIQARMP